ncbi:MAG: uracil-DNA glycosylase [Euryarchaeota archaeon]|nr:uracil-DNA glycosylase [Euryarchaeota archaeon]
MTTLRNCVACGLCENRQNIVCPDGDVNSPVAFVGEAPGKREDETGLPFQGRSGKVLDALLNEENISRSSIYITNTVKCRPPGNREPTKEEMAACLPNLKEELQNRRLIVALGRTAARDLLGREIKLADELNKLTTINILGKEIDMIATYHPAASFYNSKVKDALSETIRIAKKYLEGYKTASTIKI